jgi:flavin-dependent dehydrogenase
MGDRRWHMEEFDFLVVGSGSGLDVAPNQGQSVAVVEKGPRPRARSRPLTRIAR